MKKRRLGFETVEGRLLMSVSPIGIEAESMLTSGAWTVRRDSGASGKAAMIPTRDNNGSLSKTFNVVTEGDYSFTELFKAPDLKANSFAFQVDSGSVKEVSLPKTSGYQSKMESGRFHLAAGPHVLTVFARENGTRLDKFVFTFESGPVVPPVDPPPTTNGVVRITGVHDAQVKITNPGNNVLINASGARFNANLNNYGLDYPWPGPVEFGHKSEVDHNLFPQTENQYPFSVKGTSKDYSVVGGVVQGQLDPLAPWHVYKGIADGDGMRLEGSGVIDVSMNRIDNVEDGFSGHSANGTDAADNSVKYKLHDVYYTRIHDDMIENDATRDLVVNNVFMQGHTFYSSRGTANPNANISISNALVELVLQPHEGRISGTSGQLNINEAGGYPFPDGLGVGSILKLDSPGKNGHITISDSIFVVPRPSTSSMDAMNLAEPDVTWNNVTIVWLGDGAYPGTIPKGVTVVKDRAVFDQAKDAFFASHSNFVEGVAVNNFSV